MKNIVTIQPEHFAIDVLGNEIFIGEDYIELTNGEFLLPESSEEYLLEYMGGVRKVAR